MAQRSPIPYRIVPRVVVVALWVVTVSVRLASGQSGPQLILRGGYWREFDAGAVGVSEAIVAPLHSGGRFHVGLGAISSFVHGDVQQTSAKRTVITGGPIVRAVALPGSRTSVVGELSVQVIHSDVSNVVTTLGPGPLRPENAHGGKTGIGGGVTLGVSQRISRSVRAEASATILRQTLFEGASKDLLGYAIGLTIRL